MKRFTLFIALLLCSLGLWAQEIPAGVLGVGENITTLETGKWYYLYNNGTKRYVKENASNALKQTSASPSGQDVSKAKGYLVTLEDAGDGKYSIKTGMGNYYRLPSSTARGTGDTPAAFDITAIANAEGHYLIAGPTYKLVAPSDAGDLKGGTASNLNSTGDWSFRAATFTSPDELTGEDLYNYQMSRMGFIRLHCRRDMTSWLAAPEKGLANCTTDKESMSTLWYLAKNGAGYSLRSANTGQYLTEGFSKPIDKATALYIQFTPNNTGDEAFINISTKENYGDECLNMRLDHVNIGTWTYINDVGCDWAIELVDDVDMQQLRDNMNKQYGYATDLKDGAYYRLNCTPYGKQMTEMDGNFLQALTPDDANLLQCWKVTRDGAALQLQNVVTERYIQPQTVESAVYKTSTKPATLYFQPSDDKWEYSWYITNTEDGKEGLHSASRLNYQVVLWENIEANKWAFIEVELSDDEILAAQREYDEYNNAQKNLATYQAALDALFADKACSQLLPEIAALTDEQLAGNENYQALPRKIQDMALKVKNNTWQFTTTESELTDSYERFFRVADYGIYSNHSEWYKPNLQFQSYCFGKLSNPTGIVANTGDVLYIFVEEAPKADCTLQLEMVTTEGAPSEHQTGTCITLKQGVNVVKAERQSLLYVFYQLNNTNKMLADYPDIKVHIEGGQVQGYMDLTRNMTNQDWKNMLDLGMMSNCPVMNMKSPRLVFAMHRQKTMAAIKAAHQRAGDEMEDISKLIRVWNMMCQIQDEYQGLEEFEGRCNNIWNVFSSNSGFMYATSYGTYYHENTLADQMNYYTITHGFEGDNGGLLWGPSHEIGHCHQAAINICGTTESSNNFFTNIIAHEGGITTTGYQSPARNFDNHLANGHPWNRRGIEVSTRMFIQLYFYFHEQKHDTRYIQKLFQAMRKDPLKKGGTENVTPFDDGEGKMISSVRRVWGREDYLHLAKKCCDVAQADLSEFFEAYGMFVPVKDYHVSDYGHYYVTTTQKDIDAAKAYMKKYPKKLGNIMFIDDHIVRHKANPDNRMEMVPDASGYRYCATPGNVNSNFGTAGNAGDYEEYDGHTEYDVEADYYTIDKNNINFNGSGYVGHKVYDLDGNLIWAVNKKSTAIPDAIRNLFPDKENKVIVVAAQQNMADVPCPYYNRTKSPVYKMEVNFPDGTSKHWWANNNIDAYLPENAIAVISSDKACDPLLASTNVVNKDGTAQNIVLNGDVAAHIPSEIQAQSVTFTKSGDGYQALILPFAVQSGTTIVDNKLTHAATVEAGQPVVLEGAANLQLSNVTVQPGDFTPKAEGYVLAVDGKSTVEAKEISPFTYVFENAVEIGIADGINDILSAPDADQQRVYDLNGRRVTRISKSGVYVVNGKKMLLK